MKKRLILFVGVYDTLDIFTYELKKSFDAMGYETMLYDTRDANKSLLAFSQFIQKPVTAALTFNNLGFNMELAPGKNIWEDLGIPCINILMDHPFCYKKALDGAPSNAIVLCTDRNHMRYLNRFYPQIPITGFLPHAGKVLPGAKQPHEGETLPEAKQPLCDRPVDVLYAGNLSRSFAQNIIPDLSGYRSLFDVERVCRRTYEDVIAHPYKTTEQGIEESLLAEGVHLDEADLCQVIADLHFLDLYIVSYYRERVVASVAKAGIGLDLYGAGWEDCDWIALPNVHYHGKIPADEVVVRMQDAKIVLSTMTWFKDGTHDRVFNGMLQGAVAVSDSSIYMKEAFRGNSGAAGNEAAENEVEGTVAAVAPVSSEQELVLFELTELEQLPETIAYLLHHPDIAQNIADNGYRRAMRSETWTARAKELDRDLISELAQEAPFRGKILTISHQLSRTGAPIVLLDMLRLSRKQGYTVDVIAMQDGPLREELEKDGIEVAIQDRFWHVRDAFRELASEYDLVIANTLITYEAVQALNHSEVPVLWWIHEGEQYFEYFKTVIPDFAHIGANIHPYAVGHYVQDVVKRRYGVEIPVLHFAVADSGMKGNCAEVSPADGGGMSDSGMEGNYAEAFLMDGVLTESFQPERKVRFLTAGTYSSVKAQDVLAAAVRLLPPSDRERAEFYFCGNEELVDEEIYRAVVKLEQDFPNVTLLHQLTRAETLSRMEQVDCLIVPSRIDPIPTVAVEMLMKGGLLLCTDVCGIAHYIVDGEDGFTVPPEDPQALADKLSHIIHHPDEWAAIKHAGRKIYEEHFSPEVVEEQMVQILSAITAK
jgi:glycosyltransferase involved in cell wall biosynthesis